MLLTRLKLIVLGGLVLGACGSVALTQGPSRGGFRQPDPEETFKQYSGGKDVINVSEVTVPERMSRFISTEQLRERMNAYLQKKGITSGQMTLAQYKDYSDESRREMMEKMQKGDFSMFKRPDSSATPSTPGGQSSTPAAPSSGGPPQGPSGGDVDGMARDMLKRQDANNDGFLTKDELGRSRLVEDFDKHDLNKDGKISTDEYVEYFKARMASRESGRDEKRSDDRRGDDRGKGGWGTDPDADRRAPVPEEKRVVYRIGSLPKDLPKWFEELDKDKDGQVGLYEWKGASRLPAEFLAIDANYDGFVTVEEMIRYQKVLTMKKDDPAAPTPASITTPGAPSSPWAKGRGEGKTDMRSKFGDRGDARSKFGPDRGGDKGSDRGKGKRNGPTGR